MIRFFRSSALALAGVMLCSSVSLARGATPDATVAMGMSTTVTASAMPLLVSETQQYFDAVLSDDNAFYALLTPDYQGVDSSGHTFSAGTVFGSVQALKRQVSGIVKSVREGGFDEVALVRGTADIIDAGGAHAVSAAWVHKIAFVRDPSGDLLISRDICMQRV